MQPIKNKNDVKKLLNEFVNHCDNALSTSKVLRRLYDKVEREERRSMNEDRWYYKEFMEMIQEEIDKLNIVELDNMCEEIVKYKKSN